MKNTPSIESDVLDFIRARPIMYDPVEPIDNQPLYYNKDVVYVQIAVDQIYHQQTSATYTVLFLATGQWSLWMTSHLKLPPYNIY